MAQFAEVAPFSFSRIETQLECFASRDSREQLLQWNLDTSLTVEKFRFTGAFAANNAGDYDRLVKDFLRSGEVTACLHIQGTPATPLVVESQAISTSVMSMDFFDRLEQCDVVSSSGSIRACMEESFDGLPAGDKLRELLLNEDSDNASVFTPSERLELIFVLFRLLVLGGSMCQPDTTIARYLAMTKALYRDVLTVYKDAEGTVAVSGRVYKINAAAGLDLFSHPDKAVANLLLLLVCPLKKQVVTVKMDFKPFW